MGQDHVALATVLANELAYIALRAVQIMVRHFVPFCLEPQHRRAFRCVFDQMIGPAIGQMNMLAMDVETFVQEYNSAIIRIRVRAMNVLDPELIGDRIGTPPSLLALPVQLRAGRRILTDQGLGLDFGELHEAPLVDKCEDRQDSPADMAGQEQSELHAAARAWAEAGFAVFPCASGQKIPAVPGGLNAATTDLDQIDRWWSEHPDYNIGVSPSANDQPLFVLDVDPPLGADTLKALEQQHGKLPSTLTIRTPRGGLHYWFAGSCPSTVGKLGPKLDTRGDGGYVLVPPSVVNGVEYSYVGETDDIATGPSWIAEAITEAHEAHVAPEGVPLDLDANIDRARLLLREYVSRGDVAIEGQGGDNRTYQVACEILNLGLSPERAWAVIRDEWNPHCVPPWDKDELAIKVRNAAEYSQNDIGAWANPNDQEVFAHVAALAPADQTAAIRQSKFYPRDETEQDQRPEPTWLLPNLLPDESTVMMFGPSGNYKSFLALDLALMLSAGIAGWGTRARDPVPVVYVAAEGSRGVERLRRPAWRKARGIDSALPFYTVDTMPLIARPNEVLELIEAIKARAITPKLVVLDTFARAMAGLNENDAKDAGDFIEAIEAIKRVLHCTVLVLHHTGKEEGRGARGSSALFAGFDSMIEVKAHTDKKIVTVAVRKHKDADIPAQPWTFQGDASHGALVFNEIDTAQYNAIQTENDPFSPTRIGAALVELCAVPGAGVTTQVLATHICPPLQDDTAEGRARAIEGFARRLGQLAKGKLAGYCEGYGRDLRWFIPVVEN